MIDEIGFIFLNSEFVYVESGLDITTDVKNDKESD